MRLLVSPLTMMKKPIGMVQTAIVILTLPPISCASMKLKMPGKMKTTQEPAREEVKPRTTEMLVMNEPMTPVTMTMSKVMIILYLVGAS